MILHEARMSRAAGFLTARNATDSTRAAADATAIPWVSGERFAVHQPWRRLASRLDLRYDAQALRQRSSARTGSLAPSLTAFACCIFDTAKAAEDLLRSTRFPW